MKTPEEIEKLAKKEAEKLHDKSKHEDWAIYHQLVHEDTELIKIGYTQCQEDNNTSKVTRVEVVDETGRVYSKWDCKIELSYQDDGRTLKVFVK